MFSFLLPQADAHAKTSAGKVGVSQQTELCPARGGFETQSADRDGAAGFDVAHQQASAVTEPPAAVLSGQHEGEGLAAKQTHGFLEDARDTFAHARACFHSGSIIHPLHIHAVCSHRCSGTDPPPPPPLTHTHTDQWG